MGAGDRVRLTAGVGYAPAGSEGIVIGFYRYPERDAVAVQLDRGPVTARLGKDVIAVSPEYLEMLDRLAVAAPW